MLAVDTFSSLPPLLRENRFTLKLMQCSRRGGRRATTKLKLTRRVWATDTSNKLKLPRGVWARCAKCGIIPSFTARSGTSTQRSRPSCPKLKSAWASADIQWITRGLLLLLLSHGMRVGTEPASVPVVAH